jgi:hypothetical protein
MFVWSGRPRPLPLILNLNLTFVSLPQKIESISDPDTPNNVTISTVRDVVDESLAIGLLRAGAAALHECGRVGSCRHK